MLQHVLNDGIGPLAVLHDFVEIAAQGVRQLDNFSAGFIVEWRFQGILQFIDQFGEMPRNC